MPPTRGPYNGSEEKLVLAFDIGTTFSGVSYSILKPGEAPQIRSVTRFPAQDKVGGDCKIPTVIYYDQQANVRAVGAETRVEDTIIQAEEEDWIKTEWFKIHLRQSAISSLDYADGLPDCSFPPGKTVVGVFADFMKYLYERAEEYIKETQFNGDAFWESVQDKIDFVLTHPNGWEGQQQQQMRKAAAMAGLVPDTPEGQSRITLLTEGEASLHFCIQNAKIAEATKSGGGILVVDAGGGTVDISAYGRSGTKYAKYEEVAPAECFLQGAVFVTTRCRKYLEERLQDTKFSNDIDKMVEIFDQNNKHNFQPGHTAKPVFIPFGRMNDTDKGLGIIRGRLSIPGTEVAKFFQPSIDRIIKSIKSIKDGSGKSIRAVFLVGGFSASEYLFSKVKEAMNRAAIKVHRPPTGLNKAVAEGAVSFYLDRSVDARVAKEFYGNVCYTYFIPFIPSHRARESKLMVNPFDESLVLPDYFDVVVPKGAKVSETQTFRRSYSRKLLAINDNQKITMEIYAYRGSSTDPEWYDQEPEKYVTLCTIEADLSQLCESLPLTIRRGMPFYEVEIDLVVYFGLTELTAQIAWDENGVEKRGPAKCIYEEAFMTRRAIEY